MQQLFLKAGRWGAKVSDLSCQVVNQSYKCAPWLCNRIYVPIRADSDARSDGKFWQPDSCVVVRHHPALVDQVIPGWYHGNIHYSLLVGGLEHFLFVHILGRMFPIDFHIFQRGRSTTNQIIVDTWEWVGLRASFKWSTALVYWEMSSIHVLQIGSDCGWSFVESLSCFAVLFQTCQNLRNMGLVWFSSNLTMIVKILKLMTNKPKFHLSLKMGDSTI